MSVSVCNVNTVLIVPLIESRFLFGNLFRDKLIFGGNESELKISLYNLECFICSSPGLKCQGESHQRKYCLKGRRSDHAVLDITAPVKIQGFRESFLNSIRKWKPTQRLSDSIQKAVISNDIPSDDEILETVILHIAATILTVSGKAANRVNSIVLE